MAKKKASSHKKSSQKSPANRNIAVFATVAVLVLAAIYAFTGNDYLGLFEETPTTPTEIVETGGSGEFWAVAFTDPARINDPDNLTGSVLVQLIDLIDSAQDTIHIASFEFNLTPVAAALPRRP